MRSGTPPKIGAIMVVRGASYYFYNSYDERYRSIASSKRITPEEAQRLISNPRHRVKFLSNPITYEAGDHEWAITLDVP